MIKLIKLIKEWKWVIITLLVCFLFVLILSIKFPFTY